MKTEAQAAMYTKLSKDVTAASSSFPPEGKPPLKMKRVSFNVPERLYDDIQAFAEERGETITGVMRWSLGVSKVIWDEIKQGHSIRSTPPQEGVERRELIFSR
jgi:hypothetical protein